MSLTSPDKSPLIPRVPFSPTTQRLAEALEDKLLELDEEDDLSDIEPGKENLLSIDMLAETIQLYRRAKKLMLKAMRAGSEAPVNQQAQVVNSLGALVKQLGSLQMRLYDSERLKKLETSLIEMLSDLPEEQQNSFLARYKELTDV
jgi:hypothetical protein